MSKRIKEHFQFELTTLRELVQIPPHQTMLLHIAVYKMLHGITDYTEDAIDGVPDVFGQPMAKLLMENYYKKYEQDRLEKTAEATTRLEENPEAAEAEVSHFIDTKYLQKKNNNSILLFYSLMAYGLRFKDERNKHFFP